MGFDASTPLGSSGPSETRNKQSEGSTNIFSRKQSRRRFIKNMLGLEADNQGHLEVRYNVDGVYGISFQTVWYVYESDCRRFYISVESNLLNCRKIINNFSIYR